MTNPSPTPNQDDTEFVAMNIVHQIGDALYEALPPEIAHKYFVTARQATNDIAIDFAKKLIDRTVAERLLAIIGEDEPASTVDQEEQWLIDARNGLRAELRTAAQQQLKETEK